MSRNTPEKTSTRTVRGTGATAPAHDAAAAGRPRRLTLSIGVATAWLLVPVSLPVDLLFNHLVTDAGRPDLTQSLADGIVIVLAMVSASTVGAGLAMRRPRHPVGWLFLALGGVMAVGSALTGYASYGALARPGSLPLADVVGVVVDGGFVVWFVLIALIFHLTPDGRPLSRRWAVLMWATVVSGGVSLLASLVSEGEFDPPLESLRNPIAVSGLDAVSENVGGAADMAAALGVLVGAVSLLARYRRATGLARRQLLWLAPAAVLIPVFVAASFVASYANDAAVLGIVAGLFVVLLPLMTALAITRYHLFDVDRILSRALTYVLVTAVLAATYIVVVVAVGAAAGGSQLSAVVATLAAVSVAGPAYRRLQAMVDRRFNRRRFEAVRTVRAYVRDPTPDVTVEHVLRQAVRDPTLRVAYWVDGRREWVTSQGRAVQPGSDDVELTGHDRPIARVGFDCAGTPRPLVEAVVAAARPELDNAGLRAAIALQLVEVRESRARIVAAADASRREIERNLHDGAQQHLVAMAVKVGLLARLAGDDPAAVRSMLQELRAEIQVTVDELRELAHGIYPPLLRDHGLGEALRHAASRAALPTTVAVQTQRRFDAGAEAAVYFCCLEAMQNAGKYAGATASIVVRVRVDGSAPVFEVCDDGAGFDPGHGAESHGFVNMRDRVGALGGTLSVQSRPGHGTVVRGDIPVPVGLDAS
ncbi:histidine kinase [Phytoactinopolyspora endophytica]|uniref:sensor histidine kinase n=1 Tax=Phytoactinopolyspora endophytica TaxID=1642495 RepID=UPI00101D64CD|nr:histidine kinase [Phytoactinopolyspora endophytica]